MPDIEIHTVLLTMYCIMYCLNPNNVSVCVFTRNCRIWMRGEYGSWRKATSCSQTQRSM